MSDEYMNELRATTFKGRTREVTVECIHINVFKKNFRKASQGSLKKGIRVMNT
jgi:hypothetical protein